MTDTPPPANPAVSPATPTSANSATPTVSAPSTFTPSTPSLIPSSAAIQARLDEIEREKRLLKRQLKVCLIAEGSTDPVVDAARKPAKATNTKGPV